MFNLNKQASELMQEIGVPACTDITGFGLLGHSVQLAESSQVGIEFSLNSIPYFPEVVEFSQQGLCPGGLFRNKEYYKNKVKFIKEIPDYMQDVLFDAQTSGGLLICLEPEKADLLLERLRKAGVTDTAIIGEVVSKPKGKVIVE